jgi:hypothetical protein
MKHWLSCINVTRVLLLLLFCSTSAAGNKANVAYCCSDVRDDSGQRSGSGCHIIEDTASGFDACKNIAFSCSGETWLASSRDVTNCLPDGGLAISNVPDIQLGLCCLKSCGDFCGQTCSHAGNVSACSTNFYFECPGGTGVSCSGLGPEKDCECKKP